MIVLGSYTNRNCRRLHEVRQKARRLPIIRLAGQPDAYKYCDGSTEIDTPGTSGCRNWWDRQALSRDGGYGWRTLGYGLGVEGPLG